MCSCEHASDVVADRQAGLVRTLANQVSDNTTGAGDDVVAVALAGATPMSSASHGPTQADDLFQEQCGTPIAEKFLKRLLRFSHQESRPSCRGQPPPLVTAAAGRQRLRW